MELETHFKNFFKKLLFEAFYKMFNFRRAEIHASKKMAMLNLTNQLFRIYFRVWYNDFFCSRTSSFSFDVQFPVSLEIEGYLMAFGDNVIVRQTGYYFRMQTVKLFHLFYLEIADLFLHSVIFR